MKPSQKGYVFLRLVFVFPMQSINIEKKTAVLGCRNWKWTHRNNTKVKH